jgi:hypothetical protein
MLRFQAAVSREHLNKLGEKLERAKRIAPTRPRRGTPPNPMVAKTVCNDLAVRMAELARAMPPRTLEQILEDVKH